MTTRYWVTVFGRCAACGFSDCRDCPQMVLVPPGTATLGSTTDERAHVGILPLFGDREGPAYKVTFNRPYALGRTEVTRGQYQEDAARAERGKDFMIEAHEESMFAHASVPLVQTK